VATHTQDWLRTSLEQLTAQRQRYELARCTAGSAARERLARTVTRLDTEIAGHRKALDASDPSVSLPSRPCLDIQVDACELSGQYDKVGPAQSGLDWLETKTRVPSAVWLTVLVALVVGVLGTSAGLLLQPTMARAASPDIATDR
jgi:hypothetical protein